MSPHRGKSWGGNLLTDARALPRLAISGLKTGMDRYQRRRLMIPAIDRAKAGDPTIYFLTPDYPTPSGGIRVIYRHVDTLNAAGISAVVVHQQPGFRSAWFQNSTLVTSVNRITLGRRDLLVLSEVDGDLLPRLPAGTRHLIFNQNSHLTWTREADAVSRHLATSADLAGVLTVSQHNAEMLAFAFPRLDIRRVRLGIDPLLFRNEPAPRRRRITYMPRRGGNDARQVLQLLRGRGVLEGWEVVALEGLTHREVAAELRASRIYLAFTYQEGFGLPAAEAMACGNLVIGYHGYGGSEFFRPEFSVPVQLGDVLGFARQVEAAIHADEVDETLARARGTAAAEFIRTHYGMAAEFEELVRTYREYLQLDAPQAEAAK